MKTVVFTIIIPTFNAESTLPTVLESIVRQTFNELEILIIDGASSDDTINITNRYASKDSRIRAISENDKGVYDAMNKGIKQAKGEWLYFLGSDDYLYSNNVIENIFKIITGTEENIDLFYGNVNSSLYRSKNEGYFDRERLLKENICHQAIFYKKSIFVKLGLYDLKYKIAADYVLNLKFFFTRSLKAKYVDVTIAFFSNEGMSSRDYDRRFTNNYHLLIIANHFRANEYRLGLKRLFNFTLTRAYLKNNLQSYIGKAKIRI